MQTLKKKPNLSVQSLLSAGLALLASAVSQAVPVSVLAWNDEVASMNLSLHDAKGRVKIDGMHPAKRTKAYQVTAGKTAPVVEVLDKAGPDGQPPDVPLVFPEGIKKALLIIQPAPDAPSGIKTIVLEDDESAFAWGSIGFVNTTDQQVVFVHESKEAILPPAPSPAPVLVRPEGEPRSIFVKMFFRDHTERPIYSAVWDYQPDARILVFLVPGTEGRLGPVEPKMITEDRRIAAGEKQKPKNKGNKKGK